MDKQLQANNIFATHFSTIKTQEKLQRQLEEFVLLEEVEPVASQESLQVFYQIINQPSHIFDAQQQKILLDIVYDGIPYDSRGLFWSKCCGIAAFKESYCNNYYQELVNADQSVWEQFPTRDFSQINLDLDRTFPDDTFYTPQIKQSLNRIFRAYLWRNPTVGYIQGLNYLIFRIRKFLSEEDTFWMLVMTVETYMPPDYYVEMYGAKTHATILVRVMNQYDYLTDVLQNFNNLDYPIVSIGCKFFITIFTENLPEKLSLRVLDLFFLTGQTSNKVMFDVSLAYLRTLSEQIVKCSDLSKINKIISPENPLFKDSQKFMTMVRDASNELQQKHIDFYRPVCHKEVLDDIQKDMEQLCQKRKEKNKKGTLKQKQNLFFDSFKMFLAKYGRLTEIIEKSNQQPLQFFACNLKWPVCLYNFLRQQITVEEFAFKSQNFDEKIKISDYFDPDKFELRMNQKPAPTTVKNILTERQYHYCKANLFVDTLAGLYCSENHDNQDKLFQCKYLDVTHKMNKVVAHKKVQSFCKEVLRQEVSMQDRQKLFPTLIIEENKEDFQDFEFDRME